jgi:hypothetical protein
MGWKAHGTRDPHYANGVCDGRRIGSRHAMIWVAVIGAVCAAPLTLVARPGGVATVFPPTERLALQEGSGCIDLAGMRAADAVFSTGPIPALSEWVSEAFGWLGPGWMNMEVYLNRGFLRDFRDKVVRFYCSRGSIDIECTRDEKETFTQNAPGVEFWSTPLQGIIELGYLKASVSFYTERDRSTISVYTEPAERARLEARVWSGMDLLRDIGSEEQLRAAKRRAKVIQPQQKITTLVNQLLGHAPEANLCSSQ